MFELLHPKTIKNIRQIRSANKRARNYDAMIKASQEKIGEYKHIPYVPKVIA